MNRLWTQSDVSYDGTYYSVEDATINPRPTTKPPVWIAATTPETVERAARLGDRWLANPIAPRSEIARLKTYYDAERADHEATSIPLIREAFVAPTTEEAFETVRPYLEPRFQKYFEWDGQNGSSGDGVSNFQSLADERFLVGTPAEVCEEIDRCDEEVGLSHLLLRVHWPGLSYEKSARCIELFGDAVLPHV